MKCVDCPHYHKLYEPLKSKGAMFDFGRAKCDKYDLIVDFAHEGKLKKLKCVEHQGTKGGEVK